VVVIGAVVVAAAIQEGIDTYQRNFPMSQRFFKLSDDRYALGGTVENSHRVCGQAAGP
jgi:hypothetical protein